MKANIQIRGDLRAARVPLWQIADELGVSESTVLRRLRHELTPADRERYREALARIKAARAQRAKGA